MKRAVLVAMEMRLGSLNEALVGVMILLVEPPGQRPEGLLCVGDVE